MLFPLFRANGILISGISCERSGGGQIVVTCVDGICDKFIFALNFSVVYVYSFAYVKTTG